MPTASRQTEDSAERAEQQHGRGGQHAEQTTEVHRVRPQPVGGAAGEQQLARPTAGDQLPAPISAPS
ncbi:hypothetical protein [Catenulispora sp. GP43]|uniref:hypothetical protein n=1 Tax=Catenulispora sp. GP43 TaxID=3156263 RepID=UPI003518E2C8